MSENTAIERAVNATQLSAPTATTKSITTPAESSTVRTGEKGKRGLPREGGREGGGVGEEGACKEPSRTERGRFC